MAVISKAQVVDIKQYGDDVREYTLKLDKYHYFDPGTFLQLSLTEPKANRWPDSRNFSIASYTNDKNTIRLVIKRVGFYTTKIFESLKVGSTCYVKYSFGDFLLPYFDKTGSIICIAGGTGIAPFISFAEYLKKKGECNRMHLYYSVRNQQQLIALDAIRQLIHSDQLHISLTREHSDDYQNGRIIVDDILKNKGNIGTSHIYICGGEPFTNHYKTELSNAGALNVYTDEW